MDTATPPFHPTTRLARLEPRAVESAGIVLCDLDGCLISEGRPFEETPAFVEACGDRLWVVSNRSDTTAAALSAQMLELGLNIPAEHILLAGEFTLRRLAELGLTRLSLYAAPALKELARSLGINPESNAPEAVLLCRDPRLTVDSMGQILSVITEDIPLWVANEDLSHPRHDGRPVAETGALLAALRAIRPSLTWRCLGKPDPAMLTDVLSRANQLPSDAVFVGDNALTDGRAADAAAIPFLHIQRSLLR